MSKYFIKKLIVYFTSGLIITAILIFISSSLIVGSFNSDNGVFTFNKVRLLTNSSLTQAEDNYYYIGDTARFSNAVMPSLKTIPGDIKIIDLEGNVVFDSETMEGSGRNGSDSNSSSGNGVGSSNSGSNSSSGNGSGSSSSGSSKVDIKSSVQYDSSMRNSNSGKAIFTFPVIVNEKQVANAIFSIPNELVAKEFGTVDALKLLLPAIIGSGILLLLVILIISNTNKKLIKPIDNLEESAHEIANGNYETKIKYPANSEVAKLCMSFDMMRTELKSALQKNADYHIAQKELIASISHDLKTPVSSIKAYVEGLQDGMAEDEETFNRYLSVIRRKTDSLVNLIEDLFEHSLKDLGKLEMNFEDMYSKEVFDNILEPIKVQFEKESKQSKESHLFIIENDMPNVLISVDTARIEQVIVNLVQNSKKYTPYGGQIFFKTEIDDNHVVVTIKDTGRGISQDEMAHIFDKFYRGEKSKGIEGAGLGLSICKYIIEQHGGNIYVDSKLDEGSSFTFTIPKL